MKTFVAQVREAVGHSADQVSKLKNGNIMLRRGYFYRGGMDSDKYTANVVAKCKSAGLSVKVVSDGDHWAPFRGGASIARSSHFYVELVQA